MTSTFIVEVLTLETNRQGDTFTDIFFSGSCFMFAACIIVNAASGRDRKKAA
jgi:hypothetical protein